jgi:GntR family phosphonate transport system transcriptional regulator
MSMIDRGGALALWRQIAQAVEADIIGGTHAPGGQLPSEHALAARFGVNRHTVRQAVAHLADRGLVRVERGRGMFVRARSLDYTIAERTRFHEIVRRGQRAPRREVLEIAAVVPPKEVAADLKLGDGEETWRLIAISSADGKPVGTSDHYFPKRRLPDLPNMMPADNSITAALRRLGIEDYTRRWTRISSRAATAEEARRLGLKRGKPVLVTESLNVDPDGVPIEYGLTRLAADLVTLIVEHQT